MTKKELKLMMPAASDSNINKYIDHLNELMSKYGISSFEDQADFIANIGHESGDLARIVENLNYSAKGLLNTFKKYFKTEAEANAFARQPEKIANRVYCNRMGNGTEASGDGWRYRGRGLIQITGKENYRNCGRALGIDLVSNPDLLCDPRYAVESACWFYTK